jgi:glucokinase
MEIAQETLGVDLGGTKIRVARITSEGKILEKRVERVPKGRDAQLEVILQNIKRLHSEQIIGVGLGFPGRVKVPEGIALTAGYLELKDIPLADLISEHLAVPTFVDTDANMALFAEFKMGAGRGYQNVAMMTIGTGIGGAILMDGKMFYGSGSAAQLGHITVDPQGPICNCGRPGCVETLSSGSALGRLLGQTGLDRDIPAADLIHLARTGNEQALQVLTRWITPLKMAIDSLWAVISPEVVLLGGGLGGAAYEALQLIQPEGSPWFHSLVKAGTLGDNAGVIGAGLCAWEKFGDENSLKKQRSR